MSENISQPLLKEARTWSTQKKHVPGSKGEHLVRWEGGASSHWEDVTKLGVVSKRHDTIP